MPSKKDLVEIGKKGQYYSNFNWYADFANSTGYSREEAKE